MKLLFRSTQNVIFTWIGILFLLIGCEQVIAIDRDHPQASIQTAELPEASANNLPRWRGFNLLEKFYVRYDGEPTQAVNPAFQESDFKMIHELGFNFIRLPMDYRVWIRNGDWNQFNEEQLKQIDQAVEWGKRYSVHVMINFHRAPGYTVASPPEPTSLWTDTETQRVCAKHWGLFAERYQGVPNRNLSFNLFNEPANVQAQDYVKVVTKMAEAIRRADPDRLIVADALNWGSDPVPGMVNLNIAQATRGYTPMDVTHHRAEWVAQTRESSPPTWPRVNVNGILYAPQKDQVSMEAREPLRIVGEFKQQHVLRIHVDSVSHLADFVVKADGKVVWEKSFVCGPGEGEWKQAVYREQWDIYENRYERSYEAIIPAGTKHIELALTAGDWMRISEIGLRAASEHSENVLRLNQNWDQKPGQVSYHAGDTATPFQSSDQQDRSWLWDKTIVPWVEAKRGGSGVMVGEFGCYRFTPHDVTLRWMEDCLSNWKRADLGWAMWNFRGPFGVLDSQRSDVDYEDYQGHKLDRKMLDLLQQN